eukprot:g4631.t1
MFTKGSSPSTVFSTSQPHTQGKRPPPKKRFPPAWRDDEVRGGPRGPGPRGGVEVGLVPTNFGHVADKAEERKRRFPKPLGSPHSFKRTGETTKKGIAKWTQPDPDYAETVDGQQFLKKPGGFAPALRRARLPYTQDGDVKVQDYREFRFSGAGQRTYAVQEEERRRLEKLAERRKKLEGLSAKYGVSVEELVEADRLKTKYGVLYDPREETGDRDARAAFAAPQMADDIRRVLRQPEYAGNRNRNYNQLPPGMSQQPFDPAVANAIDENERRRRFTYARSRAKTAQSERKQFFAQMLANSPGTSGDSTGKLDLMYGPPGTAQMAQSVLLHLTAGPRGPRSANVENTTRVYEMPVTWVYDEECNLWVMEIAERPDQRNRRRTLEPSAQVEDVFDPTIVPEMMAAFVQNGYLQRETMRGGGQLRGAGRRSKHRRMHEELGRKYGHRGHAHLNKLLSGTGGSILSGGGPMLSGAGGSMTSGAFLFNDELAGTERRGRKNRPRQAGMNFIASEVELDGAGPALGEQVDMVEGDDEEADPRLGSVEQRMKPKDDPRILSGMPKTQTSDTP